MLKAKYEQTWLLDDVEDRIRVLRDARAILTGHQPDVTAQPTTDNDSRGNIVIESGALVTYLYELSLALLLTSAVSNLIQAIGGSPRCTA